LQKDHRTTRHPVLGVTYDEVVRKKSNVFLSFAYSSDFFELVGSVECFYERNPRLDKATTAFWFDPVVNDQWHALDKPFEWWATTFREAVQEIGHTLLFLSPWNSPEMLLRAWCLLEICYSLKISIALSRAQLEAFYHTMRTNIDDISASLCKIDLEKSTSFIPEDREQIFAVVQGMEGGSMDSIRGSWV
jgi:hypothetical protein